jgi:hypothetical protein
MATALLDPAVTPDAIINSTSCSSTPSSSCLLVSSESSAGNGDGGGDDATAQLMLHLPHDLFARGVAQFLSLDDKCCMRQASRYVNCRHWVV